MFGIGTTTARNDAEDIFHLMKYENAHYSVLKEPVLFHNVINTFVVISAAIGHPYRLNPNNNIKQMIQEWDYFPGTVYSATLSHADMSLNRNSYYKIQLMKHDSKEQFVPSLPSFSQFIKFSIPQVLGVSLVGSCRNSSGRPENGQFQDFRKCLYGVYQVCL